MNIKLTDYFFNLMMKKIFFLFLFPAYLHGQNAFTLEQCIAFALENHAQIKQARSQEEQAKLSIKQSQLALLPTASASIGNGLQGGRAVSADNTGFVQQIQTYGNVGLQANVDIFNFWNKHYTLKANLNHWLSQKSNTEKIKIDIKLNVVQTYLQSVLTQQQMFVSEQQIKQTQEQISNMKKNYDLGNTTESNLIELEAQLARDSLQWLTQSNACNENISQLKQAMFYNPYDTLTLYVNINYEIGITTQLEPQSPQNRYENIARHFPLLKLYDEKIKSLDYQIKSYKTKILPTLSLSAGINNNVIYSPTLQKTIGEGKVSNVNFPIGYWTNPITQEAVPVQSLQSTAVYENYRSPNLWDQFKSNYNFSFVTNIAIPIFQSWNNKYQIKNAEYLLKNQVYQKEIEANKLQQSIYQLFLLINNAFTKWQATKQSERLAERSFRFAQKKMQLGNISVTDFLTLQNLYQKKKLESVTAYYDWMFKKEILNVYVSNE